MKIKILLLLQLVFFTYSLTIKKINKPNGDVTINGIDKELKEYLVKYYKIQSRNSLSVKHDKCEKELIEVMKPIYDELSEEDKTYIQNLAISNTSQINMNKEDTHVDKIGKTIKKTKEGLNLLKDICGTFVDLSVFAVNAYRNKPK